MGAALYIVPILLSSYGIWMASYRFSDRYHIDQRLKAAGRGEL